jgi:hypothetical protein
MKPVIPTSPVIAAILAGEHDNDIEAINRALNARVKAIRDLRAAEVVATLKVGDTVRFNHTIRPSYLQGLEATVVRFDRAKIVVEITDKKVASRYAGAIRCPAGVLDKVEAV